MGMGLSSRWGLAGLVGQGMGYSVHVRDKIEWWICDRMSREDTERRLENEVVQSLVYSSIDSGCHNNSCSCENRDRTGERGLGGNGCFVGQVAGSFYHEI
jgi:hypothetical protein